MNQIIYKDIVLIGGGHAHALVIKMWGMKPVAGVRLTLISNQAHTPYSGMLPGLVSGHYDFKATHIDLFKLCSWAKVRFICNKVESLNCAEQSISMHERPAINYDILSINTGSTPNIQGVEGAPQYAIGVKPIAKFHRKWLQIKQRMQCSKKSLSIALVGAGAGGFELLMAMYHAANTQNSDLHSPAMNHQFHWIVSGESVLNGYNKKVQQHALAMCTSAGINVHFNFRVINVSHTHIACSTGTADNKQRKILLTDEVIWCTAAKAALWPQKAGLALDNKGFIAINDQLQSTSHSNIFAVGDAATQINHPRPKAGVFAVRQGPILYKNLCSAILEKPLVTYRPQNSFLSLLATGNRHAIASKGFFCAQGQWVWHWKNYIDQKFMAMLTVLPDISKMQIAVVDPLLSRASEFTLPLENTKNQPQKNVMRCGGCAAKIASSVLSSTLKKVTQDIPVAMRDDVLIGLDSPDDAAVIDGKDQAIVQSVDQFRSFIDDPYLFAKIATNHALSDLHAMASTPQSALSIVSMPHAATEIQQRELYQLSYGIIEELNKAGCSLTGGHTSEGLELSLGLCVNGLVDKEAIKRKTGARNGQQLIITKPLGTGVIMAAHMQCLADGDHVLNCLDTMLQSNQRAGEIFKKYQCSAMTDVTGFGFIGHLLETLRNSQLTCRLWLGQMPVLKGAIELSRQGIKSTLFDKNREVEQHISNAQDWQENELYALLFDPQTSGGLIAWVDPDQTIECIDALKIAGYQAHIVAQASSDEPRTVESHHIVII